MAATAPRIGVQLWVLDDPPVENVRRAGVAGYDGAEFAYDVEEADPADVAAALDEEGLDVAGAHVGLDQLRAELESTVAFYDALDCDRLVVPYLEDDRFADAEAVAATAGELNAVADRLADRGVSLCYHNHDHEFHDVGGRTALEALAADLDGVGIELDVGHVARAGLDPVDYLDRLAAVPVPVPIVHVRDAAEGGDTTALGAGDADVAACIDAAAADGCEWFVFEGDPALDGLAAARTFIEEALG